MTRVLLPWRDDCVLPEESLYSHVSKLAWFRVESPVAFLQRFHDISTRSPKLNLLEERWISALQRTDNTFLVHGKIVREHLEDVASAERQEIPNLARSGSLRICSSCLNEGIHLRLHQNLFLLRCPVHDQMLSHLCPHCGGALSLTLSGRAQAFHCTRCLLPLTDSDKFGEPRTVKQRFAVSSETYRVDGPLQSLSLWMKHCYVHPLSIHHSSQDTAWVDLWLEALCRHTSVPSEVRRTEWPQARLAFRILSPMEDSDGRGVFVGDMIDPLTTSVYRWFLRRRGDSHEACLDAPLRLFYDRYNDDSPHWEDLLECCPVAVGFWIWRRSVREASHWWIKTQLSDGRPTRAMRRAAYKAIKSHLQYCLYMAKHLADAVPRSGADRVIGELRMLPLRRSRDFLGERWSGAGVALEFDLTEDFSRWRCRGYGAYENRLKENLRWTEVVSRQGITYHDHSSEYEERRIAPGVPFSWMRGEEQRLRAKLPNKPATANDQ